MFIQSNHALLTGKPMRLRFLKYVFFTLLILVVAYFILSGTTRYTADFSEAITPPSSEKSKPEVYALGYQPELAYSETRDACRDKSPLKRAFFGDLHIHTAISADAYPDGTRVYPDDAYLYAKGGKISLPVPSGEDALSIQLDRPLDFAAVTDHAESMGEGYICRNQGKYQGYASKACRKFRMGGEAGVWAFMVEMAYVRPERNKDVCGDKLQDCDTAAGIVWQEMIQSAEKAYDQSADCSFTSFVGYEYTRSTNSNHLHRNTIYKNAAVPARPASFMDFPRLQLLLGELEQSCRQDIDACDVISIPHNSNISGGNAFNPNALDGYSAAAQQAHREQRNAFDRLAEITQHKGASECQNGFADVLSDDDEYCNIEALRKLGQADRAVDLSGYLPRVASIETKECDANDLDPKDNIYKGNCLSSRDFLRGALLEGLREEAHAHVNPFEFGIIGSTDSHLGTAGQTEEISWSGHIADETTLENRLGVGEQGRNNRLIANPGGLAGVWAVENSRDALFQSMKRREAFGTSGTRIAPRFFLGHYDSDLCKRDDWLESAYKNGTPMGSKLIPQNNEFQLLAQAQKDPLPTAQGLEKLQIIKGWLDADGNKRIKIIDVASKESSDSNGDAQLCAVYTDPEYDPALKTYYYMRAIETSSKRWSAAQCDAIPIIERPSACDNRMPKTINELAWTSPIWLSDRQ